MWHRPGMLNGSSIQWSEVNCQPSSKKTRHHAMSLVMRTMSMHPTPRRSVQTAPPVYASQDPLFERVQLRVDQHLRRNHWFPAIHVKFDVSAIVVDRCYRSGLRWQNPILGRHLTPTDSSHDFGGTNPRSLRSPTGTGGPRASHRRMGCGIITRSAERSWALSKRLASSLNRAYTTPKYRSSAVRGRGRSSSTATEN